MARCGLVGASSLIFWNTTRHPEELPTSTRYPPSPAGIHTFPETILKLVRELSDLYLLADPAERGAKHSSASRLSHDALAPLVLERFNASDRPGQRARHILQGRAGEWEGGLKGTPLDETDLALVERGESGMRSMSSAEGHLVQASRRKYFRRYGAGMILLLLAPVMYAGPGGFPLAQQTKDMIGLGIGLAFLLSGAWLTAKRLRRSPGERRGVGMVMAILMLLMFYLIHTEISSPTIEDVSAYVFIIVIMGYSFPVLFPILASYRSDGNLKKAIVSLMAVGSVIAICSAFSIRDLILRGRLDDARKRLTVMMSSDFGFLKWETYISNMKISILLHNNNITDRDEEALKRSAVQQIRTTVGPEFLGEFYFTGFHRAARNNLWDDNGVRDLIAGMVDGLREAVQDESRYLGRAPTVAIFPVIGDAEFRSEHTRGDRGKPRETPVQRGSEGGGLV